MAVAVDGGGTRCRLALVCDGEGPEVTVGPANVTSDFSGALAEIGRGLERLAASADIGLDLLHGLPAYLGIAGVTGPEMAARVREALPFRRARVEDDRPAALRGALGNRDGAIAHCGTGSFLALRAAGTMRLAGGWGPVLGDEASAQWVGRHALAAVLRAHDGTGPASGLTARLLREYGPPARIVSFAAGASPMQLGEIAGHVTAAAPADPLAAQILTGGAAEIARALPCLGWTSELALCLTGGLGPAYGSYLPPATQAALTAATGEPIDGARALARDFARQATS